jgi:hypothetical protein
MVFEMADDGGSIMPMDEVALYKTTHPVKTFNSKCPVQRIRMSEMSGTSYSNAIRKDQDELVRFNLANITLENVDQQYRLCFYDHSQEWVIDTGIELTIRSGWSLDQTELDPLALQPVTIFEQVRSKAWAAYYLAEINIPADPTMQNEEMPSAPFVFREDDAVRLCTPSCPTVNRSLLYLDPYGRPAGLAGADPYDKGLARTWAIKNWTDDFNEPSASPYCSSAVKFREVGFLTRPSVEVPPHAGFLNMDLRAGYKVYFNFTGITGQRMRQNYNLCYLHTDTLKEDGGHGVFNYDTGVRVFVKSGWVIDKKILFPDANVTVFVQEKALSHDAQITITIPATNFGAQAVGVAVTQAGSGATGTLVRFGAGIVTTADALKLSASPISGEGLTATITTQVSAVTVSAQDITTDGVGTGLVLEYTSSSGAITGITVTISGAGYTVGDRITIAHGAMDGRSTNAVFKLMPDDLLDPTIVVVTWTNTIPFDTTNAITVGDSTPATPPVPTATEVSKDEIGFFAESCPKTIGEWHDREALQDWRAAHAGTMPHHTSNSSQNIIALPTDLTHGMYMGFNFSTTPTQLLNKYWSLCVNNNGIIVDTGRQIFLTGWRLETKVTHVTASSNVKLRISEHQMNTLDSDRDRLFFTPRECPTYAQWGAEVAMADTSTEKATGAVSMHAGLDITFSFATVSAVTYRNQPFRMCFLNNAAGTVTDTGIVVTMTGWSSVAALGTFIAAQGQHLTLKALESEQVGIGTKLAWFQDKCPDSPIDYTASVGLRTNSSSISVTLSEAEQITALKSEAGLTLTFDLSFMKSETRVPREITLTIPATDFSTGIVTLTIPLTDFGLQAKGVTVTQATTGAEGTLKVVLSMATVTVVVVPTNNNAFDTSNAITVGGHATTPTPTAAVVSGPTAGEEVTQAGTLAAGTLIRYGAGLVTDVDALLLSSVDLAAAITANTDNAVVHTSITATGFGTGLELKYTATPSEITSITVTAPGTGYRVGDVITIAHAAMAGRATNAVFTLATDDLSNPTTIVVTATKLVAFDFIDGDPVTATTGGHAISVGSPTAFGVSHPIPTAAVVTKTAIGASVYVGSLGEAKVAHFSKNIGCVDCAVGKTSPVGSTLATQCGSGCAKGKYKDGTCKDCKPGTYTDVKDQTSCTGTECVAGKYGPAAQTSAGAATCTPCAAGTFTGVTGTVTCGEKSITKCGTGKAYTEGATLPVSDDSSCANCVAGKWNNADDKTICNGIECVAGKFGPAAQTSAGAATCTDCKPGKYTEAGKQTSCKGIECVAGKYGPAAQTSAGAATCADCASGTFTSGTGTITCTGTECVAGKYGPGAQTSTGAATCTDCASGTFTSGTGTITCADKTPAACSTGTGYTEGTSTTVSHCMNIGSVFI